MTTGFPTRRLLPAASVLSMLLFVDAAQAQSKSSGGGPPLLLIIGVGLVFLVVGGLLAIALLSGKKGSKSETSTISTEDRLGNYRLLNLMMTGQTSQVWEVADMSSHLHYAIKVLLPEHAKSKDQRNFLFHEGEVGKELAHPNIIRVVNIVRDEKNPHFIMDFFPGGNLKLRILRKEWDFIKQHAQGILKQAATALAFMNSKGWVHRDIKPDNILVNASGEVRVIDLAIAQKIKSGMGKLLGGKKGRIQGTRSYMSPEQIRNEALDARSDIYSFGAMAYEMVTGRPPFRAASSQELLNKHISETPASPITHNPDVTQEFADFVLKLLAKKKADRPDNFHEVLMALRNMRVFKADIAKKSEGA